MMDILFEDDGGPRYGSMNQDEWYSAVRAELTRLRGHDDKHFTETTSIHNDMLALALLVGVKYDGVSSPAGFLHGDIMPAVVRLTRNRDEARENAGYWRNRAELTEDELNEVALPTIGRQNEDLRKLRTELEQLRRERDEAVAALRDVNGCGCADCQDARARLSNPKEDK